jgi:hypothetical protein
MRSFPPAGVFRAADFARLLAPLNAACASFVDIAFADTDGLARPAARVPIKAEPIAQLREVLK